MIFSAGRAEDDHESSGGIKPRLTEKEKEKTIAFSAQTILDRRSQIFLVHIVPRTTARPTAGKFIVLAAGGAGKVLRIPVYLRILPPSAPPKGESGLSWDDVLWIDAQSAAAYGRSNIPGALPLTEEAWDVQFESILARWTPGKRIVAYCQPPGQTIQISQRLKAYGLENLYVTAPGIESPPDPLSIGPKGERRCAK